MSSLKRSFAWSFLEQSGTKFITLVVQIVLARLISPESFGILAILLVITNIADAISQSGLGSALIQKKNATEDSFSTAFWLSGGVAVALCIAIWFLAPLISSFYAIPEIEEYLRVLSIVVVFNSFNSIQRSQLQRDMRFKILFKASFIAAIGSGVIGIGCALASWGIWALVAQVVAQGIIVCVLMFVFSRWVPRSVFKAGEAKELLSFGWKVCVTGILGVAYNGISELVIGKVCAPAALGYYSQGRKYPMAVITVATNAVQNVLYPAFSSVKDDVQELHRLLRKSLIAGSFFITPLSLLLVVLAEPLVAILLTEQWLPCVPIFQLVCVSHCLMMITSVNLRGYLAVGNSGIYLKLQIIKMVIGLIVICTTAIISGDIYMVALATCCVTLFNILVVDCKPAKRELGYSMLAQYRDVAPILGLSIAASALASLCSMLGLGYLLSGVIEMLVFCAVYVAGVFLLQDEAIRSCRELCIQFMNKRRVH